jgi:hypothetical protein
LFKLFLISVVVVPVLFGVLTAASRQQWEGLLRLVVLLVVFDTAYIAMLYYLRIRWIG